MRILWSLFFATMLLAGANLPARAGWSEFWAEFDLHRRRVEAWPEPFVLPDREAVREPFRTMADNGWKQQNTLNEEWFRKESNELSQAGQIKLRQMQHELPPHRRQVYVLEGATPEITSARIASVGKYLAEIAPDQPICTVLTTRIPAPVGTAWYVQGTHLSPPYWAGPAQVPAAGQRPVGPRTTVENSSLNFNNSSNGPYMPAPQGATLGAGAGG